MGRKESNQTKTNKQMTLDGHIIKFILLCITLFLTPRQPSLRKVQMERQTLPPGPMDSFMGQNSLCGYICSQKN